MFRKVLVPIDGSSHARMALDLALELLADEDASLVLLTVPEGSPTAADIVRWTGGASHGSDADSVEAGIRRMLTDLEEKIARPGLTVHSELLWAPPAQAILEMARTHDVEAIVMGSRGRSDLAGLVLGSTSHRVLHTADRRVIIVR
ncbi:MAG TPA: universal stress protein [Pseudomonadales bacterium]|nr:universal stress protein [Pseudomonadales bacterium]